MGGGSPEELERLLCPSHVGRKVRAGDVPAQASEVSQGHFMMLSRWEYGAWDEELG